MQNTRFLRAVFVHLLFVLALSLQSFHVTAQTATAPSGTGTSGDPYLIATLDNLYWLTQTDSIWDDNAYFEQTADIDASTTSGWDSGSGFSPIGNSTTNFTGNYDGGGFTISDLYINRSSTDDIGFFGRVDTSTITNVGLVDVDITGDRYTGALIGYSNRSTVTNSHSTGTMTGDDDVGGLIGESSHTTISTCYSEAQVSARADVGGLIGYLNGFDYEVEISKVYATGNVTGTGFTRAAGGLIGGSVGREDTSNRTTIRDSYATGDVSSQGFSGGIFGTAYNQAVINAYSTGAVSGVDADGGVSGNTNGTPSYTNVYWNTETSGQSNAFGTGSFTGATGRTSAEMLQDSSFSGFDFDSTWAMLNGITEPFLQSLAPDSVSGFPMANYPLGGGTQSDPYLITSLDNLEWLSLFEPIWNDNAYFQQTTNIDASATATWNAGAGFSPIGNSVTPFNGNYDGNNHTISNLNIHRTENSDDEIGFFGETNNANIANLGLVNVNMSHTGTSSDKVGPLIGDMDNGTVTNVYATGSLTLLNILQAGGLIGNTDFNAVLNNVYTNVNMTINGTGNQFGGLVGNNGADITDSYAIGTMSFQTGAPDEIGGLVGFNEGTITRSYATIDIDGPDDSIGGLVGENSDGGHILNSYSTGDISNASDFVGGLVGYMVAGSISNSYSTGSISGQNDVGGLVGLFETGTASNVYYNTETSGQANGIGTDDVGGLTVTGLTSGEMFQEASFSGFDFTNTWTILELETFPYLQAVIPDTLPGSTIIPAIGPGGSGTALDPYRIDKVQNLAWIAENDTTWSSYYLQTADIDASASLDWNDGKGFSPIGNSTTPFNGSYDGDNRQISNLFINRSTEDEIGFFGVTQNSIITRLELHEVDITGNNSVGALVGLSNGVDDFSYTSSSGTISGNTAVGGMVGTKYDENVAISFLTTSATVNGVDDVGGIIGSMTGSLTDSYATGTVNGTTDVGGLVGIGAETPRIFRSYSTASVNGDSDVGGLMGRIGDNSIIEDSYAVGSVVGNSTIGGITGSANPGSNYINVFWNIDLTGQTNAIGSGGSSGISSLTTGEMIDSTNFSGFDFTASGAWNIDNGFSFPYLKDLGNHRMAVATIDSGEGWRMIGNPGDITYSELFEPLWTQGFTGADSETGSPNVYFYEESTQIWTAPSSADNFFGTSGSMENTALNGALFYVYGDDDNDGNEDGWPKYLISEFTNIADSFSVDLSHTSSLSADSAGWNLISNPYPVALDWTEVVTNNDIANTFPVAYIWDDSLNAGAGAYRINYGYPLPPGLPQDLIFDGPIPAMQAFWVKATAANATLGFKPTHQSNSQKLFKQTNVDEPNEATDWISLKVEHGDFLDHLVLFEAGNFNVPKLKSIASRNVQLSTTIDEQDWASHSLSEGGQEIPLQLSSTETGTFTLSWSASEDFFSVNEVFLVDTETGISTKLSDEDFYQFTIGESPDSRFVLVVNSTTSVSNEPGNDLPSVVALDQNYPNPFNPSTNIRFELPQSGNVELAVFDILGRQVATLINERMEAGYHEIRFDASRLASGVYLYQMRAGNAVLTRKLTLIK